MSNMSYCRFQNTLADLRDCQEALAEDPADLLEEERLASEQLIDVCKRIVADYGDDT